MDMMTIMKGVMVMIRIMMRKVMRFFSSNISVRKKSSDIVDNNAGNIEVPLGAFFK